MEVNTGQGLSWQSDMPLAHSGEFKMSLYVPDHLGTGHARVEFEAWGTVTLAQILQTHQLNRICGKPEGDPPSAHRNDQSAQPEKLFLA